MLFSDSLASLTLPLARALPAQRVGLAVAEKPSVYASIREKKDLPASTPKEGGIANKQDDSSQQSGSSKETGGFQEFGQQLERMWRRWKKPLLVVGGVITAGTLGTVAFWGGNHFIYENVKTSIIPEKEELAYLWQRFEDFQNHVNQLKQSSHNDKVVKIKAGYALVALFQDALDINKFIYNEISDADRKKKANQILKTVLDYALDYEQDVLPSLIRRLHKSQRLTSLLDETQVPAIETPFRRYIQQNRNQYLADDVLKAPFARYENDRRAVDVFKAYDVAKDAQHAVQEARLFQQERKGNKAESNFEMACMLDLYTAYLKDYHPHAYNALSPLAKKLEKQDPTAPSTLVVEDLKALCEATHLNVALYPWEVKDDPIYFSQGLRDLMDKILSKQDISPQNHGYHKKTYG